MYKSFCLINVFTAANPIRIYCPFVTQSAPACLSVLGAAAVWCANGPPGRCRSAPPPFELAVQRLTSFFFFFPPPPADRRCNNMFCFFFWPRVPSEMPFQTPIAVLPICRLTYLLFKQVSQRRKPDEPSAPARFHVFMGAIKRRLSAFNWVAGVSAARQTSGGGALRKSCCSDEVRKKAAWSASPAGTGAGFGRPIWHHKGVYFVRKNG